MSRSIFKDEYNENKIKSYNTHGFRFKITPRFKSHYIDSPKPYEWLSVKTFNTFISNDSTVIDVGAHYGYYALNAAREVGKRGRVIAIEPIDFNRDILRENISANGFSKVVDVDKRPVSNSVKKVTFNVTEASDNSGFYNHPNTRTLNKINRTSTTIDSLVEQYKINNLSVMKIDAEGHECEILDAAHKTIYKQRPYIFLEFNPKCLIVAGHDPEDMITSLLDYKYKLIFIDDINDRFIYSNKYTKTWRYFVPERGFMNMIAIPSEKFRFFKRVPSIFSVELVKI